MSTEQIPLKQIPRRILARVDPDRLNQVVVEQDVDHHLRESLNGRRYMIVLDDMWERRFVQHLRPSNYDVNALGNHLPNQRNGSCVLLTSRLEQMVNRKINCYVRLLNKEESWDLLREKVFREESFSTELEKAGKKIAENCEGLPLTIVTLADRLSKVKESKHWNEVAANKNRKLYKDVYEEISKVIRPSYNFLPQLLQICFLYMGVFPQNYKIPRSKVVDMWNIDGFLERKRFHNALECLEELVWNSLVMIYNHTTCHIGNKDTKSCGLHTSLWYFSTTEARKNKFCLVLSCLDDGLSGDLIGQCRLSFHNNILCNIKDVYKSVEDNCASTTRSLFYYGPYHPYEVPICFGLRLLRELDVLTIRLYEFPIEILQLVELRYLALTLDGKLPPSISQLSNLRFLIVGQHFVVIKPSRDQYLPVEIWNMPKLQHLQAMGSDLPHPRGASMENLSTLSDVSPSTCTKGVFEALPNLKKLRVRIELGPNYDGTPLRCFDHISNLEQLTSLKCVVVYPMIVSPLASIATLPSNLRKLSLSGLGFPWKETRNIAALPNLEVLKLQNYAFIGPHWRVEKFEFPNLQLLVIEDSDLVEWSLGFDCFKSLHRLTLKHCYKYERMVGKLRQAVTIEFFACNPSGILQMQETLTYPWIEWKIHSSFSDGENESQ